MQCRTRFFDAPQSVGVDIFVLLNWFARFEIRALSLSLSLKPVNVGHVHVF